MLYRKNTVRKMQPYLSSLLVVSMILASLSPIIPTRASAQTNPVGSIEPLIQTFSRIIDLKKTTDEFKPSVPTQDKTVSRDSFITGIALKISQILINRMVDSTIRWANEGFDGRPAYVVNKKQYFGDIVNGIAGEYIEGTKLGFLCSPFQNSIRLSLAAEYTTRNEERPFQCTFSEAWGNIEDFYQDFNQGGWDAWFAMTQNPTSNPYGSYIEAKIELDSRLSEAINLEKLELEWGGGFLSVKPCIKRAEGTEECLEYGPTRTPGGLVKSGIEQHVDAEFAQLLDVERFDQLLGALMGGLMQKYIFSDEGLFRSDKNNLNVDPPRDYDPLSDNGYREPELVDDPAQQTLSCSPDTPTAGQESVVIWTLSTDVNPENHNNLGWSYSWNLGADANIINEVPFSILVTYPTKGSKSASVSLLNPQGQIQKTVGCSDEVVVSEDEIEF